jgi:hypothetical protein
MLGTLVLLLADDGKSVRRLLLFATFGRFIAVELYDPMGR